MKPCALMLVASFLLAGGIAPAAIVAPLDLVPLIDRSDLVVTGTVVALTRNERPPADVNGEPDTQAMTATLAVDRYLKGVAQATVLSCTTSTDRNVEPLYGITDHTYRVYFLSGDADHCRFTDARYLSLPAVPAGDPGAGNPVDRVASVLAAVLSSSTLDSRDTSQLIGDVERLPNLAIRDTLRRMRRTSDASLSLRAGSALLLQGDLSGLPAIEAALLEAVPGDTSSVLWAARENLRAINDPTAIPALGRLLDAKDVQTRRAAAAALRHTTSAKAVDHLIHALDDPDEDVQYEAVSALAGLNNDHAHGPFLPLFRRSPRQYVEYWKAWAAER